MDWSASPLGEPRSWPSVLRTAIHLILASPESMFLAWGPELRFFFNDAYVPILGSRLPGALGAPLAELWSDVWDEVGPIAARALAGDPSRFHDLPLTMTRHGVEEKTWWSFSYSPLRDEAGAVVGMFCVTSETTQRVLTDRAIREMNTTLERRVEERTAERDRVWRLSRDLIGVADSTGVWLSINPAWTRVLGWDGEQIRGRTSEWLEHPDDRLRTRAEVTNLAAGHETLAFENRFRTRQGDYRLLNWTAFPEDGLLYCVGRDVTVERERETALRNFQDFARLALSAVGGVGVWTYDVATDRFTGDAAISELYGLDPDRAAAGIERSAFLANVHPDDRAGLQATMSGGLEQSGDLELEYRIVHPGGAVRWVLSRGHTYFDDAGRPTRRTGVGVETTRHRQLEEQLRQSQKMEAVGQLTGGLAHDFNNLLTGITGSLELLQTRLSQGRLKDVDRYVRAAQGAAQRAAALTHRLLAFSRRQTLEPKPTWTDRLLAEMLDLVRRTVGPSVVVGMASSDEVWPTLCDANQLENAVLNLCINARDAMPDGGRITLQVENTEVDERFARSRDMPAGQYVAVSVTDTGTGMKPDVVARAFDPFFTTKPLGEGTGLGLSMVYGFAKQSGGQVRIHSVEASGTTVSIYLPRHRGEVADEAAPPPLTVQPKAVDGETVLVVDDEPTVRMLVLEVLQDLGCAAIEAADGASGLKVLMSDVRIDLLVTDVGLPGGMNGRQMADAARVIRPELRVLFITGYAEGAVFKDTNQEADIQVLTKPFTMEALASRIQDLVSTIRGLER